MFNYSDSDELCKLLLIPQRNLFWGGGGDGMNFHPDLLQKDNLKNIKEIFSDWSTPYKFIEKGDTSNGVQTNYWAHKSGENYLNFLLINLPRVLPDCLRMAQEKAGNCSWNYYELREEFED